jgi:hypothetical protein
MVKKSKRLIGIILVLTMLSFTTAGISASAVNGATPTAISGFLPIGPYSNGAGWGSIYSDGSLTTGSTYKFINGYVATGVSLGIFGGYVQFDMGVDTPIQMIRLTRMVLISSSTAMW